MTTPSPAARRALVAAMPKAELHLHLDGSLRPGTALDLARTRGVPAPADLAGIRARLVAPPRVPDQATLLEAFDLPIALLQDAEALERAAAELVEDVAADGTRYVEIRWAPLLHTARGLGGPAVVEAVGRGARAAGARHGVEVRLIATLLRSHDPGANLALVEELAGDAAPAGLVAVDLAGQEARFPDPLLHGAAFAAARAAGLRVTVHAAEWGGAAQVRRALALEPDRIAHGAAAWDDPALVAELRARGTWLDLCPTSNAQAGIVPSLAAHPLPLLARAGVRVTLSTDDRTVSDLTLVDEYERGLAELGLAPAELWAIDRAALDAAFCEEPVRRRLAAAFDAWAAGEPRIRPGN